MSGWQPIETAPCDDTWALVWDGDTSCAVIVDLDHDSDPAWWRSRGYTHWMPMPDPPLDNYTITDAGRKMLAEGGK